MPLDPAGRMAMLRGMSFSLHPRLAAGGFEIGAIGGCRFLLKNNALFPWFLLVPEVEDGIEDLHQLPESPYVEVMTTVRRVSQFVSEHFQPEKLNVACIGNQVRQMHIHIVGRSSQDPAWPGTVWAFDGKSAYSDTEVSQIIAAAKHRLGL
jgi:diadenosine tetraphosphate (Ap4A) HIT family hydrolase